MPVVAAAGLVGISAGPAAAGEDADWYAFDADTGEGLHDPVATLKGGPGFLTFGLEDNAYTYTIKLVASARVEQYRSVVQDVANELNSLGLARITVASGQYPKVSVAADHEIMFDAAPTSPCGVANVAGCAGPGLTSRADGTLIGISGSVWILPVTDSYPAANKRHVVGHEIGHALGLQHFDATYNGVTQIMHSNSYAVNTFQAGDRNGLSALARDVNPIGALDSVTVTAPGKLRVYGWAFDPDQSGAATVQVTVDGARVAQQSTGTPRPDVNAAYRLPNYAARGFSVAVSTTAAAHVVCVSTLNYPRTNYVPIGSCAAVTATGQVTTSRIQGADRFESAAAVSQAAFPTTAPVVVVASGENFPDALSAGPVASKLGGPLLLGRAGEVPAATASEIARLKPSTIIIAGGVNAIGDAAAAQLSRLAPTIVRAAGADRYDTSRQLAALAFPTSTTAYVASGDAFPDGLTAGAAAAALGGPLLLISGASTSLDAATLDELKRLQTSRARVVGGTAVIAEGVVTGVRAAVSDSKRISGADRFGTAAAISGDAYTKATSTAYVANGLNYPDGLVTAPLAAKTSSPVFLSAGDCLDRTVLTEMNRLGATKLALIGGTATLNANVAAARICN